MDLMQQAIDNQIKVAFAELWLAFFKNMMPDETIPYAVLARRFENGDRSIALLDAMQDLTKKLEAK